MSGTYPQNPSFEAVNFKINTPTITTRTNSGLTRRVSMGISYYSFTAKHTNLTRYQAGPILGFVAAQYGPLESFQIYLPELSYSKTTNQTQSAVSTSGDIAIGATQVNITGVQLGKESLRAGDFFKFQNHSKVYQCIETPTGNTIKFSGSLVKAVPSGTAMTLGQLTDPVPFTVILENDVQQWDTGIGGTVNISLDMREVWQ